MEMMRIHLRPWQRRWAIDSVKALAPWQPSLRRLKHHVLGYRSSAESDLLTVKQGLQQIEWIAQVRPIRGATVLEIGSGWMPIIPMLFILAGAARVYLTDMRRLISMPTLRATISALAANGDLICGALGLDPQDFVHQVKRTANVWVSQRITKRALEDWRLAYLAPCDCRDLPLPSASVDLVTSRAALEYIPPSTLKGILRESARLLSPDGIACHVIDNSDHWQHIDPTISRLNFLRFSDSAYRWTYINPIYYLNRLRHSQYLHLHATNGFTIIRAQGRVDAQALEELATLRLDAQFREFDRDDLATLTTWILARKAGID